MIASRSKAHPALLGLVAVLAATSTIVKSAESPRLLPAAQPAGAWTLQWDGRPGRTYFLQQSHDLRS